MAVSYWFPFNTTPKGCPEKETYTPTLCMRSLYKLCQAKFAGYTTKLEHQQILNALRQARGRETVAHCLTLCFFSLGKKPTP